MDGRVTPNDGLLDGPTEYSEEYSFDCAGNDADCDGYDVSVDCNDEILHNLLQMQTVMMFQRNMTVMTMI